MPDPNEYQGHRQLSKDLQELTWAGVELLKAWNKLDESINKNILRDGTQITKADKDIIHKKVMVIKTWDKLSKRIDKMVIKNMDERKDDTINKDVHK